MSNGIKLIRYKVKRYTGYFTYCLYSKQVKLWNDNLCLFRSHWAPIGKPVNLRNIAGDGNCFYRCISYAITGTEEHHEKVRRLVSQQLVENIELYQLYLDENTVPLEYITAHETLGTWAMEVQIFACCTALNVNILIWTPTGDKSRWNAYTPLNNDGTITHADDNLRMCIYLDHSRITSNSGEGLHFDYVQRVSYCSPNSIL